MGKKIAYIKRIITYLGYGLLEIIYPRESYCIICGKDDCNGICTSCMNSIKPLAYVEPEHNEQVINSYGHYGGALKKLILNFKRFVFLLFIRKYVVIPSTLGKQAAT